MAYDRVNTDRFGNPYTLAGCKPNKKNPDFCAGYVEIAKPGLYKLEPSQSNNEKYSMWVRVTKVDDKKTAGPSPFKR